ncbi:hypothetical protein GOEFS_121_00150 [Gordonia effusa NBRC 100432]|uniref:DUF4760 domain-containing protein n=1 Tax=Gordonia effusa NBRC 100432 TaxID=1077974 RepID=H0R6B2_9ACTN|nr:hypothetical protein [Gordonia effusa]GAB20613.1 hypothetical protein GOEFS_121_00150 [Gordonia effusa NBRC 100432]
MSVMIAASEAVTSDPQPPSGYWWAQVLSGPLTALMVGLATIVIVGMAGRRREAEVQLNNLHRELTSERTNAARDRLFRQMSKQTAPIDEYAKERREKAINDYFTLLYAVEYAAITVKAFCSKWPMWWGVKYFRGVLPRKRAEFLKWHLDAIKIAVNDFHKNYGHKPLRLPELKDEDAFCRLQEHYETLSRRKLLTGNSSE